MEEIIIAVYKYLFLEMIAEQRRERLLLGSEIWLSDSHPSLQNIYLEVVANTSDLSNPTER